MSIRHVRYEYHFGSGPYQNRGLVAVGFSNFGSRLFLKTLSGNPPKIQILKHILDLVLEEDWVAQFEEIHQNRKYPWLVERRGYSYLLRYLKDESLCDCPVGGRLHVSMYDKLNQGFNLWVGDVNPLLARVLKDYPQENDRRKFSLRVSDPEEDFNKLLKEWGPFNSPAYASGLADDENKWAEIAARYSMTQ